MADTKEVQVTRNGNGISIRIDLTLTRAKKLWHLIGEQLRAFEAAADGSKEGVRRLLESRHVDPETIDALLDKVPERIYPKQDAGVFLPPVRHAWGQMGDIIREIEQDLAKQK